MKSVHKFFGLSFVLAASAAQAQPQVTDAVLLHRYPVQKTTAWTMPLEAVAVERGLSLERSLLKVAIEQAVSLQYGTLTRAQRAQLSQSLHYFLIEEDAGRRLRLNLGLGAYTTRPSGIDGWIIEEAPIGRSCPAIYACADVESKLGIISDVDDTVKESNVLNKQELFRNTFLEPFKPIEATFTRLEKALAAGPASLHFVTGSPWQLHDRLTEGLKAELGGQFFEIHMRPFHVQGVEDLLNFSSGTPLEYKVGKISAIFDRYPHKSFVLFGDTTEKDPEVYAEIQKRYGRRVLSVHLRKVAGSDVSTRRFMGIRNLELY